ncbi:E3 ubiquitin-protein ligase ipaH3 [compost metagenome]
MPFEQELQQPVTDSLAQEQAYQDGIIHQTLPAWMQAATAGQLQALGEALRRSLVCRQQLKAAMAHVQGLDTFASKALEQALNTRFKANFNVQAWTFTAGYREPVINAQPVGAHLTDVVYASMPMLEAALRNFTLEQVASGGQFRGNHLSSTVQDSIVPPSAQAFAQCCRELDLGGQYQRYLLGCLQPGLLASSARWNMLVDACKARIQGILSEDELQCVAGLCHEDTLRPLDGASVVAKQLKVLGCDLEQIVVLDIVDEGLLRRSSKRILVYIPGDPLGPWSGFDNVQRFARKLLGQRLREPAYQRFFSRFVRRRDSQRFFVPVIDGYRDLASWANIDLDPHVRPYRQAPLSLFDLLAQRRIEQIEDDAAMIAVPVAALDREVQRQHDQRLAAEGWTLLNLAGLFVPIIGAGLLALTAWELLGEVFHGVEAWHDGDDSAALDHVLNVAVDVATIGVTALAIRTVSRAWQGSALVDSLVPARLEDARQKLWQQDLSAYRSQPAAGALRDAEGISRLDDQAWIEMDNEYYPVSQRAEDGRWQLRPREGHGPVLSGNGDGAWRLWSEQPTQWDGQYYLFRRFGQRYQALNEEQIDDVLAIHGMDADQLRALHMDGRAPEALIVDSIVRARLGQHVRLMIEYLRSGQSITDLSLLEEARRLPGAAGLTDQALAEHIWAQRRQLLEQVYDRLQISAHPGVVALRRRYPALHRRAAYAVLGMSTAAERQSVLDGTRIPARLDALVRAQLLRIRMTRVHEAFRLDVAQPADLALVVLGLLKYLPGASAGVRWRLFEGSVQGSVLFASEEGASTFDLCHLQGRFQRLDAHGVTQGEPGELFEVMAHAYTEQQRAALQVAEPFAHNLRVQLARLAARHRGRVEQLLDPGKRAGGFRAPRRLADGRIGYMLSGRSPGSTRPQALFVRVRALYPGFTDAQVLAWLSEARQAGLRVDHRLDRLEQELQALDSALYRWVRQPAPAGVEDERLYFRESLIRCWQRMSVGAPAVNPQEARFRLSMYAVVPGRLPELPAQVSFAHVHELAFLGMALDDVPHGFLRAFPNLRILELSGNQLTRLPNGLEQLEFLRELDLFNNRIVLNDAQADVLTRCDSLEYINLSYNPLGRSFALGNLNRLRRLHLRSADLGDLPQGVLDSPQLQLADLRDNRIARLPERFFRAPEWIRRSILLADNPLPEGQARRLRPASGGAVLPVQEPADAVRQRWLGSAANSLRDEMSACWADVERAPGARDFFDLLQRLSATADYQQRGPALASRVFAILQAMRDYAGLREELFSHSRVQGCQDSAALCFANLELRMLVWRARGAASADGQESALLRLGRQLWRLDEVDRIAVQDIQQRRVAGANPDEIEVGLAYRLALQAPLDLPIEPGAMLFSEVAGLTTARLEQARQRVQAAETAERLAQSLVAREFWQEHLLRSEVARFERLDAPFHERLAALMEDQQLPDSERVASMNQVGDQRTAARQALLLELTRARLQPPSARPGDRPR